MSKEKHCYCCGHYKPYYIKGRIQFDRCDIGLCTKKGATMEKHAVCEEYTAMQYSRIGRKQAALKAIAEHINILAELKQVLTEDDEEAIQELIVNFVNRKSK